MERRRDIRNLIVVLAAAVMCAGLLAFAFIHYHSPTGRYRAGNVILDPAIIQQINQQDTKAKGAQKGRFVFDHFEFSYFDKRARQVRKLPVSLANYQKFYQLLAHEQSIADSVQKAAMLFMKAHPTRLITSMRGMNGVVAHEQIFQVIELIEENYFRVQLHEEQRTGDWVYFYRANCYQEVMKLFMGNGS